MTNLSAREILDILVAFPSVSRGSNLPLIEWVEEYLNGFGINSHRVYNEEGDKAELFANVGPDTEGGTIFSGHTDVVPVDGQEWHTDPFVVTEKDGLLYGRGTCDMKGYLACALAAVPYALSLNLKRPMQLAFSYDEEVGCTGAPPMIDAMVKTLPRADVAVIGEPSMMKAVTSHKGGIGFMLNIKGFEIHSSLMHQGVNAIMEGARIIEWANQQNTEIRAAKPTPLAQSFNPPFTTLHVGQISGGTAHNITAKDCAFGVDFRFVPGENQDDWCDKLAAKVAEVEKGMQAVVPETSISMVRRFNVPALQPEEEGAAEGMVRGLTGDNGTHVVSYGTEAGQFQERGYSSVICGPGDIAQAHQPDEFLSVEQFKQGEKFVRQLVDLLAH